MDGGQKIDLTSPVEKIRGVGPKTAEALKKNGFFTVKDLLYYFPRAYEDYQKLTKIADITPGKIIVKGKIRNLKVAYTRRRNFTITHGEVYDETGSLPAVWYNQPYRAKAFDEKKEYYFTGDYGFKYNRYQFTSPAVVQASEVEEMQSGFQPIYSSRGSYKSVWFKRFFENLRGDFADIPDLISGNSISVGNSGPLTNFSNVLSEVGIPNGARREALFNIHFPESAEDVANARDYLGFEELFELILAAKLNKNENAKLRSAPLPFVAENTKRFVGSLPFQLTDAQRKATWEILQDLEKTTPMNRLLQGDVGSGKTVVAAIASFQAVKAGFQVALLAPTAILATQHAENFEKLLTPLGVKVGLLIGATKNKDELKKRIKSGEVDVVIGTHAILTDDTIFNSLALCIIDEQHRFGVMQRQKLLEKVQKNQKQNEFQIASAPHFLAMTATPIPRSLQLTVFGDLDVSIIGELPKGRQKIETEIISEVNMRESLYPKLQERLDAGEQFYWICKKIDGEESSIDDGANTVTDKEKVIKEKPPISDATNVKAETKRLQKVFPKARIEFLHGKMKPDEKDQKMQDFKDHKIDILVSTTVVEVGVDVPNATQIVIMDAEGFGLAQLHQLRGRVGRGNKASNCYLVVKGDNKPSRRLTELENSTDGFHLAEVDLKLRGPGEIYGAMQHGELNLKIANITDTKTIARASRVATKLAEHPENLANFPELLQDIQKYQQLTTLN